MTTPAPPASAPSAPPAAAGLRAAIELLDRFADQQEGDFAAAVRTLLTDHAELTARHTDRGHRFAKLYIRVETARTVCDESGRYVETVDVLRALAPLHRTAGSRVAVDDGDSGWVTCETCGRMIPRSTQGHPYPHQCSGPTS